MEGRLQEHQAEPGLARPKEGKQEPERLPRVGDSLPEHEKLNSCADGVGEGVKVFQQKT